MASATEIAKEIRARIKEVTGLTASAGVSYNKFLAKIASDQNKPDGLCVITPAKGPDFVATLPVRKFHGVGPATAAKMNRLGIETGADLKGKSLDFLRQHFGISGPYYYWISRGVCHRQVKPDRIRKSVGAENTFFEDVSTFDGAVAQLEPIIGKLWRHVDGREIKGRTVTLKVKFSDFQTITRSRTLHVPVDGLEALTTVSHALLEGIFPIPRGIRLLGVTLSSLGEDEEHEEEKGQLALL